MKENEKYYKMVGISWYLYIFMWFAALYWRIIGRVRCKKTNFKSYKEPALILCTHASMIDMANVISSMFPRLPYWVSSIEECYKNKFFFSHLGVLPKRKFTTDLLLIKNIVNIIKKKHRSVCIYPEARYSFIGINEDIGTSLGKLAKICQCRVIIIHQKGNYLFSPQWNKHPYRFNKVRADAIEVFSREDAINLSADELQAKIEEKFQYDEYRYANEHNILIKSKYRAHNIHRVLYKCPCCNNEDSMRSNLTTFWCEKCHSKWELNEDSTIKCLTGENKFKFPSDWYRWEKEEAIKEVNEGKYHFIDDARIEKLVSPKEGFVEIGTVKLTHDLNGYQLKGTLNDGSDFNVIKTPLSTRSIHLEFDFNHKGDAIDISTLNESWWVYPLNKCNLTKFNFTTEAIFDKASQIEKQKNA